jgi:hypothetical protein
LYAERFIRTLKGNIYRYMMKNQTQVYIDHLDDFVDSYLYTVHRGIGMHPMEYMLYALGPRSELWGG